MVIYHKAIDIRVVTFVAYSGEQCGLVSRILFYKLQFSSMYGLFLVI